MRKLLLVLLVGLLAITAGCISSDGYRHHRHHGHHHGGGHHGGHHHGGHR